ALLGPRAVAEDRARQPGDDPQLRRPTLARPAPALLLTDLIHGDTVGASLTRSAAARPDKIAVVDGGRRLTYAELDTWVNRIAHGLAHAGWQRGDALGLASGNSAEFLAVYYACAKLGLVCVPINLGWRADEVAHVGGHARAKGLAIESQLVEAMGDALRKATGVTEVIVLPGLHAEYA